MGAVLTPSFVGLENARDLPDASTLCGACAVVCPVNIPLPDLLRTLRVQRTEKRLRPWPERLALKLWGWLARHPSIYGVATGLAARWLHRFGGKQGLLHARRSPPAGPMGAICRRRAGARSASYKERGSGNNTMNSRDAVLTRIRQQLGRPSAAVADHTAAEARIVSHARGPLPVFSTDLVARFREKAASLASTVDGPMPPTAVPAAIARYLAEQKLSPARGLLARTRKHELGRCQH